MFGLETQPRIQPPQEHRCRICDEPKPAKWICYDCIGKTLTDTHKTLHLQLDVLALNADNPELLQKIIIWDRDEVLGVVVPDTLDGAKLLGMKLPSYYKGV